MQLPQCWLKKNIISWLLWPISLLFGAIAAIRRWAYRHKIFATYKSNLPVIVIGNISVGGTGKTPVVIALANYLKQQGWHPAIISRGYKSQAKTFSLLVTSEMDVNLAGDEPYLIACRTGCPVMIDPQRVRAVKALEAAGGCDIIISDDGLQHYALARDLEIVVVDGHRQFGNGFLLPAGMLREPTSRLNNVDMIIVNGTVPLVIKTTTQICHMNAQLSELISLTSATTMDLKAFANQQVHAIAGIGNPQRFFDFLRQHHIDVIEHAFPDHHLYTKNDFTFLSEQNLPIIMTEKDAVKCKNLVYNNVWYVKLTAALPNSFYEWMQKQITK